MSSAAGLRAGAGRDHIAQRLESLSSQFRELFDAIHSIGDLSTAEVRALVEQAEVVGRQADALEATVAGMAERADVPHQDAGLGARGWLKLRCGIDGPEAHRRLQTARLLTSLDDTRGAYEAGRVGTPQVRRLARAHANPRVGHQLRDVEDLLLEDAQAQPFDEFDRLVRQWEELADQDGAEPAAEATHRRRYVRMSRQFDGSWYLEGSFAAVQGAAVATALAKFEQAEFVADCEAAEANGGPRDLERTAPQRRADALLALVEAAGRAPRGRAPEPLVNIVIDQATFERELAASQGEAVDTDARRYRERLCSTTAGDPVAGRDAVAAALVGHVRRVVMDGAGAVIDLGRRQRIFTGAARDAALLRHRTCVWSGCDHHVDRCQTDHIIEWQHGGATDARNGAPLCGKHNRLKSTGYRTWCDEAGTWRVQRPDGTLVH